MQLTQLVSCLTYSRVSAERSQMAAISCEHLMHQVLFAAGPIWIKFEISYAMASWLGMLRRGVGTCFLL